MHLTLKNEIHPQSLCIDFRGVREGEFYRNVTYGGINATTTWILSFKNRGHDTQGYSELHFVDRNFITARLVNELFFSSELHKVYKLRIDAIEVGLSYSYTKNKFRYDVRVTGNGHHSFLQDEATDFKTLCYSSPVIEDLVNMLLNEAIDNTRFA